MFFCSWLASSRVLEQLPDRGKKIPLGGQGNGKCLPTLFGDPLQCGILHRVWNIISVWNMHGILHVPSKYLYNLCHFSGPTICDFFLLVLWFTFLQSCLVVMDAV